MRDGHVWLLCLASDIRSDCHPNHAADGGADGGARLRANDVFPPNIAARVGADGIPSPYPDCQTRLSDGTTHPHADCGAHTRTEPHAYRHVLGGPRRDRVR